METSANPYILYGFLAFISVMLTVAVGGLIRLSFVVGKQNGQLNTLEARVGRIEDKVDENGKAIADVRLEIAASSENIQRQIAASSENTQRQIATLSERIIEVRTLIFGINERINLLMRHRHDSMGQMYIVPEEMPSD